jgi:mannose-1-phosphate guanylyltransferase
MWAGMECLVVPRHLGWTDVGTWTRLEGVLHDQRVTSIGPALQLDAEDTLVASMDGRPVVTLGARGLIIVTHEDAVYVLDKQKALDTGTLDRLRSLLAASTREDLL